MRAISSADSRLACSIRGRAGYPGQVPAPGQLVPVQHRRDRAVADGVRGDPPARLDQRRDPAGQRRAVQEQHALFPGVGEPPAHRAGPRPEPAVGVELDALHPNPGAGVARPPGGQVGAGRLGGQAAGQIDAHAGRQRAGGLQGGERIQVTPAADAHLSDLDQPGRGRPGQPASPCGGAGSPGMGSRTSIGVLPSRATAWWNARTAGAATSISSPAESLSR
jgi:hypothetical protein